MLEKEMFGAIARRKGYITEEDVQRALTIQQEIKERGEPHKLIGIVMLEHGILSSTQLLDVLKYIENRQKSKYF